ncbi:MAG: hypothetical protein ACLFSM_09870, partial [Thermoplasmata archaeon]
MEYSGSGSQRIGQNFSTGENKIKEAVRKRDESDRIMSPLWILSPLLAGVVFTLAIILAWGLGPLFGSVLEGAPGIALIIIAFVLYIFLIAYPWYLMIKRRTEHFKRDHLLMNGIIEWLDEKQSETGANLTQEMATLRSIASEANSEESEKNPILYTILALVIPYIGILYVLYFLMKDVYEHHQRITAFMENTQRASNKVGESIVVPSWKTIEKRSFVIYFIISCICGIFMYYWMYTIIRDYNQHFKNQWRFEDQLLNGSSIATGGGAGAGFGGQYRRSDQQQQGKWEQSEQQQSDQQDQGKWEQPE